MRFWNRRLRFWNRRVHAWNRRAWILTAPRTGSTYLCYLLNKAAGLPVDLTNDPQKDRCIFGEHLHPDYPHDFRSMDPLVSKVHWPHFAASGLERPAETLFILLKRHDVLLQAVSNYVSEQLMQHHVATTDELRRFQAREVPLDEEKLVQHFRVVLGYDQAWAGYDGLTIYYEDLHERPLATVKRIFEYLETPFRPPADLLDLPLQKLNRPDTEPLRAALVRGLADRLRRGSVLNDTPPARPPEAEIASAA